LRRTVDASFAARDPERTKRRGVSEVGATTGRFTRVHATATGLVQGVGYRYFAMRLARNYGITGWVRNRDDGSVELEAEGEEAVIKAFIKDLGMGPHGADVSGVRVERIEPTGEEKSFTVRF